MPIVPVIERAIGAVNGVNRVFSSSADYVPGSVQVFRNGLLGERTLVDGWNELGGRKVRLQEAPRDDDVIQIYYLRP